MVRPVVEFIPELDPEPVQPGLQVKDGLIQGVLLKARLGDQTVVEIKVEIVGRIRRSIRVVGVRVVDPEKKRPPPISTFISTTVWSPRRAFRSTP